MSDRNENQDSPLMTFLWISAAVIVAVIVVAVVVVTVLVVLAN